MLQIFVVFFNLEDNVTRVRKFFEFRNFLISQTDTVYFNHVFISNFNHKCKTFENLKHFLYFTITITYDYRNIFHRSRTYFQPLLFLYTS